MTFEKNYNLGTEIANFPPFRILDAYKKSDDRHIVVKMFSKLSLSSNELIQLQKELKFWKLVSHPRIAEVIEIFDEEAFTYIIYDFPEGGDLQAMIIDPNIAFSEGFAKRIAYSVLSGLVFLHANGICHGGCLPSNVVFFSSNTSPGWVESSKLAFFKVNPARRVSMYTDLRDLSYTLCAAMRRTTGMLSTSAFNPKRLMEAKKLVSSIEWLRGLRYEAV